MPKPLAVVPELESELDKLYGLPPAEFTAARNDLARRLKQAGQAETSADVAKLRKPTVAVWAVNQLARRHPDEIAALLAAGNRLRAAQEQALRGGESDDLRAATAEERQTLRTLTQHAQQLFEEAGHSPAVDRVAATLRAAALDPDTGDLLVAGRMPEELEPTGFGAFAGMQVPATPARKELAPKRKEPSAAERKRAERLGALRAKHEELVAAAREAGERADDLESDAKRARREAERAAAAAERAGAQVEAAERAAD